MVTPFIRTDNLASMCAVAYISVANSPYFPTTSNYLGKKGRAPLTKGRILCTEDDPDTRDLLTFVLKHAGFNVVCSKDAEECLYLIPRHKFDLLLIDNLMSGLSSEELCIRIREFDKKTPILFYSGAASESDKQRARDAGAQGYLVKPVLENVLLAEVVRIIAEATLAFPIAVVPPHHGEPIQLDEDLI